MGTDRVRIIDVTLREGSYVVDLGFTAADTRRIAIGLESAGVRNIEIGHAWGLNAAASGFGEAGETDERYLAAAAEALTGAKFGTFCLVGVARPEDVRRAASFGVGFVRVGANVTAVEQTAPLIGAARECGLFVSCNLMKSYVVPPRDFAVAAKAAQAFGADVAYLVDSAGGMLPVEVARYCRAVGELCDVPLGFHAHDNLGVAVANTLIALEEGAVIVDASLQGLGRSAGNTTLELLVALLHRQGVETGIDLIRLMDVGEGEVQQFVTRRGVRSIDISVGFCQFHSSFLGTVLRVASESSVDARHLIYELCKIDRVDPPSAAVVETVAARLARSSRARGAGRFGPRWTASEV